jgi:hypothetical protein
MTKNKYNATKAMFDGITFASKKECEYYVKLKFLKADKAIKYFLRQIPFDLPGGVKYRCDFMVVHNDQHIQYIDVKGFKTKEFIMKKKMVEALYPIEITVV